MTLRKAAARAGLLYGSDSDVEFDKAAPGYPELFKEQCDLYAPNMNWRLMAPKPGLEKPAWRDPNIAFAEKHGLRLSGGHLFWHGSTIPEWTLPVNPATIGKSFRERAAQVAALYGGNMYSWNVVNEALYPWDGRADGLRRTPYSEKLGLSYLQMVFNAAKEAAPKILRVLNEYSIEMDLPNHERKRTALLSLLDRLQGTGTPVEAVGIQSHLRLDGSVFNQGKFRSFLREIAGRGLKIVITELDVFDKSTPPGIAARDRAVAGLYREFLDTALDEKAVKAVITWGLSDRYTWLTPKAGSNFVRSDGLPGRPLPFDADFKPKPAYNAMLSAFLNAPKRDG
jgi:endo-1,4-beta-xylanase